MENTSFGIVGTIKALEVKTAMIDLMPKKMLF
jgi:hypothetical protein